MKKNYIYLLILVTCTIVLTLFLSSLYKNKVSETSYFYEKLNKITATEFEEYIIENPDTIIYIADKNNLKYNKFEKKLFNNFEKLGLLENVIYLEKKEITKTLKQIFKEKHSYEYNEKELPIIIVVVDGNLIQRSVVGENSQVDTIIDYGVFEW